MKNTEILKHFQKIAQIPHCSYETSQLRDFLIDFAKSKNAEVKLDKVGNIHIIKGQPKVCLQAHYDMVCVGEAPKLDLQIQDEIISAKNSSLGADNGMGVAIAMQMLCEFDNIECLFSNDEEVGMLGANGFEGEFYSKYLLNLDSEDDSEVIVGCAGGINVFASISNKLEKCDKMGLYEIKVLGHKGGHSGVEIHKNIPNAIKTLGRFLRQNKCYLVSIEGGERSNSVPANAKALALCKTAPKSNDFIKVKALGKGNKRLKNGDKILSLINSFSQGVRSFDKDLSLVNESINLSIIKADKKAVEFEFFARAMSEKGVETLEFESCELAKSLGFKCRCEDRSSPWKPDVSDFAKLVHGELIKFKANAKIAAVHAGLECGVFLQNRPNLHACSIGPNIISPHTTHEHCELSSVDMISEVVRNVLRKLQA
ncbi:MAG: M20/M25/M40 family metallo-hydrolase [Campylobacter sp.]|nr:M20/M25/M40 family metallo-hydrolase [Campylobacter sp.]